MLFKGTFQFFEPGEIGVQSGGEMTLESGLALERELQQRLFESADAREGIAAFVDSVDPALTMYASATATGVTVSVTVAVFVIWVIASFAV